MGTNSNHFSNLAAKIQESPQNLRTEALIEGIAQTMQQQSGAMSPLELSSELRAVESQLVRAFETA